MDDYTDNGGATMKISVAFERKVSDGAYGSITAKAWAEKDIETSSLAEAASAEADLFAVCKAIVLDELGIPFTADADGVVREKQVPVASREEAPAGGGTRIVGGQDNMQRVDAATGGGGHQLRVMNPEDLGGQSIPDWLVDKTAKDGVNAVWYNGHKATGKQPHWRQAISREQKAAGVEAKAYWPPSSGGGGGGSRFTPRAGEESF
jgi:hypothetical protein